MQLDYIHQSISFTFHLPPKICAKPTEGIVVRRTGFESNLPDSGTRSYHERTTKTRTMFKSMLSSATALALISFSTAKVVREEETEYVPDFCGEIQPHLPNHCSCTSLQLGAKVGCTIDFLDVDTIGLTATLDLCDDPASADIRVNDTKLHIDHELAGLTAGKAIDVPIPGLSLAIPKLGSVGVNAVFDIEGDLAELDVKIGIDACADVLHHELCGEKLTHKLPIYVLDHTFDFGSLCANATTMIDAIDRPTDMAENVTVVYYVGK